MNNCKFYVTTLVIFIFVLVLSACDGEITKNRNGLSQFTNNEQSKLADTKSKRIKATVTKVVDGDTIKVAINGKKERVRMLLVDTPESVHPKKPVQPFGKKASKFANDTLSGKDIELELDVSERDKYGRLLAYVWVDGKMFNEMLLEKGLARVAYVFAPNVKYVDQFREIQKEAQKAKIGIWSIENYATDKGFNGELQEAYNAYQKKYIVERTQLILSCP